VAFDRYFDEKARRFSAFYRSERVARVLGRGALFDRLRFAVEKARALGARHVLDVGCGSGPLFEPLAQLGIRVTGVEPAPEMVALAQAEAERFPGMAEVRREGWEDIEDVDAFDLAVALGVFDYVDNTAALLRVMSRAAPNVVGSFPSRGLRTDLRRVRYGRKGVAVHGYDFDRLVSLAKETGLELTEARPLGRAGHAVLFTREASDAHATQQPTPHGGS
jgi:SAM-dependent methyltransferase